MSATFGDKTMLHKTSNSSGKIFSPAITKAEETPNLISIGGFNFFVLLFMTIIKY